MLHMLREEMGDSLFIKSIKNYYNRYKFRIADTRDFEAVVEEVCGRSLKWFFDQWLYRPGIPALRIEQKTTPGELVIRIHQEGKPYRLPLHLRITSATGEQIEKRVLVEEPLTECSIKVKGPVKVEIDPHVQMLFRRIQ